MKSFQAKSMKQQNSNSRFGNAKGLINASGKAEHNLQKPKIAFVCQRYGLEVNGGSELYCRQIAERLTSRYDVTVYTSCALDYATWANKYKPGTEDINGVHVKRYKVIKERNHKAFDEISAIVVNPNHTDAQEQEWFDKQGPLCPGAVEAIKQEHGQYEAVLFMTYLYYLTVKGLPLNLNNAALIPTVHDEPWVYLRYYDTVFGSAKALVWNTEEEKTFALRRFPSIADKPDVMTGIGVDVPLGKLPELPEKIRGAKYIVYAGRIDESKGCREMFEFFLRYKKEHGGDLKLVLMGKEVIPIPKSPDIIHLGFVSEEMKFAVMAQAVALVLFSRFESLSMVVLESMMMGRPVLVTGHCDVLKGHCIRSNAGLYFDNYHEFVGTLNYLLNHPAEYAVMRENGKRYVEENYRWDVIIEKYCKLIAMFSKK